MPNNILRDGAAGSGGVRTDPHKAKVAARRHALFLKKWIYQPTVYPIVAVTAMGGVAVLYSAWFHFRYDHSIVVNKSNPLQVMTRDSEHIFSREWITKNSPRAKYYDSATNTLKPEGNEE
eukprot:TRINITY_DN7_c7_g1_i1.p1 TRINITY_DN7_c7_g1~~TRINITY_DN7_c7_g1_i1.p1  ORF type:complete len:120 (-),score=18.24 TRINITY_DN7_c7_g1_i1:206-565(-)